LGGALGHRVAADFGAYRGHGSRGRALLGADEKIRTLVEPPVRSLALDECLQPESEVRGELGLASSLILFLAPRLTEEGRRAAVGLLGLALRQPIRFVGIVSTFRVHIDDPDSEEAEQYALSVFGSGDLEARAVVFRPGHR